MEERIRQLFKRYTEGKISDAERNAVDEVFNKAQHEGLTPKQVKSDQFLKARLDQKIYQNTLHKDKTRKRSLLVAASTVLALISAVILLYMSNLAAITTVVAENGQQLRITLPDSSVVYLNSGSQLSYSEDMAEKDSRLIQLKGEAYFEVSHNPENPFIVESPSLKTRVLGTRFVVYDHLGEEPSVTVRSGKVGVEQLSGGETTILEKGQRVAYRQSTGNVEHVDASDYYSWKDGKIVFNQANLQYVITTLSRRFDVKLEMKSELFEACTITGSYYDDRLDDVLKSLEFIYGIEHSVGEGGVIYIKAKPC